MSPTDEKPAAEPVETQQTAQAAPAPNSHEPRNFLAAFLLTMVAGPLGLRHFYLGDKKLGWLRTGLFLGGYVWLFTASFAGQAPLASLGFLAIATAAVWSVVDFFYVYNAVKTDKQGAPLASTSRDRKWAKLFYWAAIIGFIGSIVIATLGASYIGNEIRKGNWGQGQIQNRNNEQEFNMDDYLRQLEEQTQSDTQLN